MPIEFGPGTSSIQAAEPFGASRGQDVRVTEASRWDHLLPYPLHEIGEAGSSIGGLYLLGSAAVQIIAAIATPFLPMVPGNFHLIGPVLFASGAFVSLYLWHLKRQIWALRNAGAGKQRDIDRLQISLDASIRDCKARVAIQPLFRALAHERAQRNIEMYTEIFRVLAMLSPQLAAVFIGRVRELQVKHIMSILQTKAEVMSKFTHDACAASIFLFQDPADGEHDVENRKLVLAYRDKQSASARYGFRNATLSVRDHSAVQCVLQAEKPVWVCEDVQALGTGFVDRFTGGAVNYNAIIASPIPAVVDGKTGYLGVVTVDSRSPGFSREDCSNCIEEFSWELGAELWLMRNLAVLSRKHVEMPLGSEATAG